MNSKTCPHIQNRNSFGLKFSSVIFRCFLLFSSSLFFYFFELSNCVPLLLARFEKYKAHIHFTLIVLFFVRAVVSHFILHTYTCGIHIHSMYKYNSQLFSVRNSIYGVLNTDWFINGIVFDHQSTCAFSTHTHTHTQNRESFYRVGWRVSTNSREFEHIQKYKRNMK